MTIDVEKTQLNILKINSDLRDKLLGDENKAHDLLVITSDLKRTALTAEVLELSNYREDHRFSTFDIGKLSGSQITDNYLSEIENLKNHPYRNYHQGESYAAFKYRVVMALIDYLETYELKNLPTEVVIITHQSVLELIFVNLLEILPEGYQFEYLESIMIHPNEFNKKLLLSYTLE